MSAERVYIIDRITVKPGQGEAFARACRERYQPGAEARGMRLELNLVAPPLWLQDQANTLLYVWSVEGVAGYWGMSFQGRQDPALQDWWWQEAAPLIESRERWVAASLDGLSQLIAMPPC